MNAFRSIAVFQLAILAAVIFAPGPAVNAASLPVSNSETWTGGPRLHVGTGHSGPIRSIRFSSTGDLLMTASTDGTVRLWDAGTGREIRSLGWNGNGIADLARDGKLVAMGQQDGPVELWNVMRGVKVRSLPGGPYAYVRALAFSSDARVLACAGSYNGTNQVVLWDVASGAYRGRLVGPQDNITSVAFSPKGDWIACGSEDRCVWIWSLTGNGRGRSLAPQEGWVKAIAVSPDGRTLASAGDPSDPTVTVWEIATGQMLRKLKGHDRGLTGVALSPDGMVVASAAESDSIRLWDARSGEPVGTLASREKADVSCLAFSSVGRILAAGEQDRVMLWEVGSRSVIRSVPEARSSQNGGPFLFSRDGRLLARRQGVATELWDMQAGKRVAVLPGAWPLLFGPDGKTVLFEAYGKMRSRDLATGQESLWWDVPPVNGPRLALSPDGKLLARGGTQPGQAVSPPQVTVREVANGRPRNGFSCGAQPVSGLWDMQFSDSGDTLMCLALEPRAISRRVSVWTTSDGRDVATQNDTNRGIMSVFFEPRGRLVALDCRRLPDGGLPAHGLRTGQDVAVLRPAVQASEPIDPPSQAACSPSGRRLATVHNCGTCILWDWPSGRELARIPAGGGHVVRCGWSTRDDILATCSREDAALQFWRVPQMERVCTLFSDGTDGWMTFLPDGYYRASRRGLDAVSFVLATRYLQPRTLQTVVSGKFRAESVSRDPVLRAFPFDQFDVVFNRPDIVMQTLGCGDKAAIDAAHAAYGRRLGKMGLAESDVRFGAEIPMVEIDRAGLEYASQSRRIQLHVRAADITNTLDRFLVWANNVPLYEGSQAGRPGFPVRERGATVADAFLPIDLATGDNEIQVSVLNAHGLESPRDTVRIRYAGDGARPTLWIAAVGVSLYKNGAPSLQFAAQDANDIAALATNRQLVTFFKKSFAGVEVLKRVNDQAVRESILDLRSFLARSTVDDTVILFAAGHGFLDSTGAYYFGAYDVDPARVADRGVSFESLSGLLDGIPARRKLFLLDTCHAGELDADVTRGAASSGWVTNTAPVEASVGQAELAKRGLVIRERRPARRVSGPGDPDELFADLRRGSGASILAACGGEEYSVEGPQWGNGVFTYAVVECLRDGVGDANSDSRTTVTELQDYVRQRVQSLTNGRQNPTARQENLADDFVVGGRTWLP